MRSRPAAKDISLGRWDMMKRAHCHMQRAVCPAGVSSEDISLSRSATKKGAAVKCSVPSLAEVSGKGYQFGLLGHEKGRTATCSAPYARRKRLTRA